MSLQLFHDGFSGKYKLSYRNMHSASFTLNYFTIKKLFNNIVTRVCHQLLLLLSMVLTKCEMNSNYYEDHCNLFVVL